MTINYTERLARTRAKMDELGIGLLYIPPSTNLEWLLGIPRERPSFTNVMYPGGWLMGAFVGLDKGPILAVPRMFAEFDLGALPGMDVRVLPDQGDPVALAREVLGEFKLQGQKVAVEDRAWSVATLNLQALLPDAEFTTAWQVFQPLRMVKDETEIALMRRAGELVDLAMTEVLKKLRVGVSELEILTEIDYQLLRLGARATSFPTSLYIINPKRDSAMVHDKGTSTHPIEPGIAVPFDFGAVYEGYCSDFGRTVWIGEPPAEYLRTHELVMQAQAAGAAAMKAGQVTAAQVDAAARQIIAEAGYGSGFRHRLGHGIGMDVHEPPFLTHFDHTVLQNGMTFTDEPSIVLDDRWMVRVEDVFVVREGGGEALSHYSRELMVVS
jgi:Xaa-Pro dipeptidase